MWCVCVVSVPTIEGPNRWRAGVQECAVRVYMQQRTASRADGRMHSAGVAILRNREFQLPDRSMQADCVFE